MTFPNLWDHSRHINNNWYHRHSHMRQLFFRGGDPPRSKYLSLFWLFLFSLRRGSKIYKVTSSFFLFFSLFFFFFLVIITRSGILAGIRWSVCILKCHGILATHSLGQILVCAYTICLYGEISISSTIPSGSPSFLTQSGEFFTSLLNDSFSLNYEGHQLFSGPQDFSKYCSWS